MSEKNALIFRWVLLVGMCAVIFIFSSFPAEESSSQSSEIVNTIISVTVNDFDSKPVPEQNALTELLTVLVRKGAHFTEYAVLSALAFCAFVKIRKRFLRWLAAFAFAAVYSCSDEFHQLFVPGRAGMVRDVILDSCGSAFGAFVACFISLMVCARLIINSKQT
ncbi:VanZ family protein [uncultured Ruminococcus sp.]|uniref:VanZ family protein n=1 Tax=uncultured Ruminococcus sp. TaxID=165186 RepID=UPI000ED86447|nr:VanZ family protein [uncultured Ruminococcus sp.]HCJ41895.1 VanZ family protein [Ruminococcus sp.]